ncbi:MAG: TonB-dependent siderophore receptor [Gammaproteobacteria bacterium]
MQSPVKRPVPKGDARLAKPALAEVQRSSHATRSKTPPCQPRISSHEHANGRRSKRKPLALAVHAAALGLAIATGGDAIASTVRAAETRRDTAPRKTYNVPPAPLTRALNRFAREAGLILSFDRALAAGKQSAGLSGEYSVEEGLRALLAGTGVIYRFTAEHTVTLEKIADSGVIRLSPITVVAEKITDLGYASAVASTATRLPESILDTPRSVNVVPETLIEDRAILDPQEAIQNVSGVQRGVSRTGVGESYLVRGFAQQALFKDGFRAGQSPGTSEFTFEGPNDVANLERIEVLKGPSAILYGRGEPGGTLNYVTQVPAFENRASLQQHFGNFDFYRTELHANGTLASEAPASERFAARLDAAYQTNASFIDFVEGQRFFAAPAFRWRIGPETALALRGEYANDDRSTALALPVVEGRVLDTPYDRYFGEPGFTEIGAETWRGLATLDHRWSEDHATSISIHGVRSESEGGNFILFNFAGPLQDPVTGDIARAAEIVDFTGDYFTARIDHTWDWTIHPPRSADREAGEASGWRFPAVQSQLLIPVDFDRQAIDGNRVLSGHSPLNPLRPRYTGYAPRPLLPGFPTVFIDDNSTEAEATSLLLLDRLSFGDAVILSFGGRYEWFDGSSKTTFSPAGLPFAESDNDLDEQVFNPSVGLLVKPIPHLSLFGSYSESTNAFQNIRLRTVTGEALEEERSRQYEVGVKAELFDGRLFATTALFQIDKSDVAGVDPDNPFFSVNRGNERSRGIELDIAGEPLPGWRLTANYAYIDAEITDDPSGVTTGNRLAGVPEHSGGFFTTYEIQNGLLQGFGFGGGLFVSDRVELDDFGTAKLPGWEQLDAVLFYKRKHWVAQLNIKNLLDEEFFYASSAFEVSEVQRAPERTILGSLSFKF